MSKAAQYRCDACGQAFSKLSGQCPECNAWNTLEEARAINPRSTKSRAINEGQLIPLSDISSAEQARIPSGIDELDRVLGCGIVRGSVVLLGCSPGIGKSTLLLQMLAQLADHSTIYVSGEESAQQISMRAERLKLQTEHIKLLSSISLEEVQATLQKNKPTLAIIDSIQTIVSDTLSSAAGSVSQVRECAGQLVQYAKNNNTTLFVVGHITKEGTLA